MSGTAVLAGIDLAIQLITRGLQISQMVSAAQAQGRTEFTPEEWASILEVNAEARARLEAAVAAARVREAEKAAEGGSNEG